LTETLRQEVTAKGINSALIENIIGYCRYFQTGNVTRESLKGPTKEITQEVADVFNAI
jgi:hypothetical protein